MGVVEDVIGVQSQAEEIMFSRFYICQVDWSKESFLSFNLLDKKRESEQAKSNMEWNYLLLGMDLIQTQNAHKSCYVIMLYDVTMLSFCNKVLQTSDANYYLVML